MCYTYSFSQTITLCNYFEIKIYVWEDLPQSNENENDAGA